MKKKMIRRILAMVLIVCMAAAIATTASAGTYNWVVGNTRYTAYVGKTGASGQPYYASSNYGYCNHTSGSITTLTVTKAFSFTVSMSGAFPSAYSTYLNKAMNNEGLSPNRAFTVTVNSTVRIPSNATSGRYAVKATGPAYDAEYSVTSMSTNSVTGTMINDIVQPMALVSGNVYHAPSTDNVYLSYYKLS